MSGLISGHTAEEWDKMADHEQREEAECRQQAVAHRARAAAFRDKAQEERTAQRRPCQHPHKSPTLRSFSDDNYSQWTEEVLVCDDCGEWWRTNPSVEADR